MVEYKIKKEKIKEIKKVIAEFVNAVKKNEPETLVYEAFQLDDKSSFVHFMLFKDDKAKKIHETSSYVKKFVDVLYPNCTKKPKFTELNLIKANR